MNNSQAALLAAATHHAAVGMSSSMEGLLYTAANFKAWLDRQDEADRVFAHYPPAGFQRRARRVKHVDGKP